MGVMKGPYRPPVSGRTTRIGKWIMQEDRLAGTCVSRFANQTLSKKKLEKRIEILQKANLPIRKLETLDGQVLVGNSARKRFTELSVAESKGLIEGLAKDYAKIFNAGFFVEGPGVETWFKVKGKWQYCFSEASLNAMDLLPKLEKSTYGEFSKSMCLTLFHRAVSMNDFQARTLFVKVFKKNLGQELNQLFTSAIKSTIV